MLLLYKYALILVILLNINEIRSRTLNDLQGGDLQLHNGTVTSLIGAVTEHDKVHNLREKRARDSEEEDEENDDDEEEDDDTEDDDSTDEDEPSEKAAVELDENYMKNHDMVDTHMTELYNEVVGKKKTKSSTKDGSNKYEVKPEIEETDKVDYEKDKDQGEKAPSKKKKKGGKDKFMPLLIIPYAIQMVIIPFVLLKLKMIALKAMAVGKLALLILLFNYFKYQHNAKASSADEQYIHDNQLMSEHYGYSGTPEVGGWVNGRSMEEFGRRRRR